MLYKILLIVIAISCQANLFGRRQADSAKVWLTVTDTLGKTVETIVSFKGKKDGHSFRFKTNAQGLAVCTVPSGQKYTIAIPVSDDLYDYESPAAGLQEVQLMLAFNTQYQYETANQLNALMILKVFNAPAGTSLLAKTDTGPEIKPYPEKDRLFLKVPIGQSYTLFAKGVTIRQNKVDIPDKAGNILHFALYFKDAKNAELIPVSSVSALIFVKHTNLDDKPVNGEKIVVQGKVKTNNFNLVTDTNGTGLAFVPKNDSYLLSLKYFPDFLKVDISSERDEMITDKVNIHYPGTVEIEARTKEELRLIAMRDSLYKLRLKQNEMSALQLRKSLEDEVTFTRSQLTKDARYFEKTNNVVCAVLYRNLQRWNAKMIVTDVTGSMYPYMHQIALWHMLQLMNKEKSAYVFFNDGDNKPDDRKRIGSTGGIYFTGASQPDSVIKTMYLAMQNGGGGDAPENDVEALMKAEQQASPDEEVILVADNYAPVKDISLLTELHRPVRVVLCGLDYAIQTDYLWLAYQTGGSIHTIEEDITNLAALHDEDKIRIGGKTYQFVKGRFFLLNSSKKI